jgi:hypothetical protein
VILKRVTDTAAAWHIRAADASSFAVIHVQIR